MADLGLSALTAPLSDAEPCGPDLEAADDDDYLNAIVTAETVLPPDYYVADYNGARQPFDQDRRYAELDLGALIDAVAAFNARTRDLRLLALLVKLSVLAKNLPGAQRGMEAVAVLLETRWDEVHPRGQDGDFGLRRDVLQRLDDPLTVTALQHVPLFMSKRHGAITWHRYVTEFRKGAAPNADQGAEAERVLAEEGQTDLAVLLAARDELVPALVTLEALRLALRRIRAACAERMEGGPPAIPALGQLAEQLHGMVDRVYRLVEAGVARIDPSAAREPPEDMAPSPDAEVDGTSGPPAPGPGPAGIVGVADAAAVLVAATDYFERAEPSNPALLLLRQAQALVGKSFLDAMQILLPDAVAKASLDIGNTKTLVLPLSRLAASRPSSASPPAPNGEAAPPIPRPPAASRAEAMAMLAQVGAYFRAAEPSSPIPMLTDGARALTGKDFMALLADVLPKETGKATSAKT